jgi:hypothetical protein
MQDEYSFETGNQAPKSPALILQIGHPMDGTPLRFPAVVRNLVEGVVTLEVEDPGTLLNSETLKGRTGSLHLLSDTGLVTELQGSVTQATYTVLDRDHGQIHLGLKLADPAAVKMLLSEHLPYITADIKSLWDRWDQAHQAPKPAAFSFSTRIGLAALTLLISGVALQSLGPKPYKLLGWLLWLFGTLLVGGQILHFWLGRRASR